MTVEAVNDREDRYTCDCCGVAVIADLKSEKYEERIRQVFGHGNGVSVSFGHSEGRDGGSLHLDLCLRCITEGAKLPTLDALRKRLAGLLR